MLSDRFRAAVEQGHVDQAAELHEDAAFRSPVLFKPYTGRDQVLKVLRAAKPVLAIDKLTFDADGLIIEEFQRVGLGLPG